MTPPPSSTPPVRQRIEQATGRELDALVAEHVFDLSNVVCMGARTVAGGNWDWTGIDENNVMQEVRPFSTSLDAAGLVLEKMNKLGFVDYVGRSGGSAGPIIAKFAFDRKDAPKWTFAEWHVSQGSTRAEAICKAALLAVLSEKEQGGATL